MKITIKNDLNKEERLELKKYLYYQFSLSPKTDYTIEKKGMKDWQKIAYTFGFPRQYEKFLEGFHEVQDALSNKEVEDVIEELTDLKLITDQLIYLLQGTDKSEQIREHKIKRTLDRIKNDYYRVGD